jgi:hypothetical protein
MTEASGTADGSGEVASSARDVYLPIRQAFIAGAFSPRERVEAELVVALIMGAACTPIGAVAALRFAR